VLFRSAYETLGVASTSSTADIRAAYRARSRLYHPDRNPSAAAKDVSQALNNAYMLLSDEDKRRAYDASNFKDTSGIKLFDGIKVTADGVAVSIMGSVVGGTIGAGVGAVSGAAVGAVMGATNTLRRVAASAFVQRGAEDTWAAAVGDARARHGRTLAAALGGAAARVADVRATPAANGEVVVEYRAPGATGWRAGIRAARGGVAGALPALRHLVAPPFVAPAIASLVSADDMTLNADAVAAMLGSVRTRQLERAGGAPGAAALPPAWAPAFLAALYAGVRSMRAANGVVDDDGGDSDADALAASCAAVWPGLAALAAAGTPAATRPRAAAGATGGAGGVDYDDPRVATARALGVAVDDVAPNAPTSALGMLSWAGHLVSKSMDKARAAEELEAWLALLAVAAAWSVHPPVAGVAVTSLASGSPAAAPASAPAPADGGDGGGGAVAAAADAAPPATTTAAVTVDSLLPPPPLPTVAVALASGSGSELPSPPPPAAPAAPAAAAPRPSGWRMWLPPWRGGGGAPSSTPGAPASVVVSPAAAAGATWQPQEPLAVASTSDSVSLPASVVRAAMRDDGTLLVRVGAGLTVALCGGAVPSGAADTDAGVVVAVNVVVA